MKNELNLRGSAEYEFSEALARAFCRKLVYLFFLFFAFHCFLAFVCLFFLCKSVPASFSKSFYHHCQCCRQSNIKIDGIKNHWKEKYPYVLNSFLYEPCKGPNQSKRSCMCHPGHSNFLVFRPETTQRTWPGQINFRIWKYPGGF